jgi:hypothetical protein
LREEGPYFCSIAAGCFSISCGNVNSITPEPVPCEKKIPDFKHELKIDDRNIPFYFWQGADKHVLDNSYALGIPEYEVLSQNYYLLSELQMGSLLAHYHITRPREISDHAIVTCILYADITKADRSVTMDNIIGAAIYFVWDQKLEVYIFEKVADRLVDIKAYNSEVNSMPVLDFYKIGLLLKKNHAHVAALLLTTKTYSNKEFRAITQNSGNSLKRKLEVYFK